MPDNKNILDKFINKQLEKESNPFLADKVMNKIVALEKDKTTSRTTANPTPVLFRFAAAAGIAAVLTLGVFLGNTYKNTGNDNSIALNINDTQIENLYLYDVDVEE